MSASKAEDQDRAAALATLTDEERAAIESDDATDEEKAALKELAGEPDDAEGLTLDDKGNPVVVGEKPEDKPAAKAEPNPDDAKPGDTKPAPAGEAEDEELETAKLRVALRAVLPEDYQAQLDAVDAQESELATKFKAGDIEAEDFLAENKRIAKERSALDAVRIKAEMAADINTQTAEQEWQWNVSRFLRQVKKGEGIDYATDKDMGADFDAFVKALAANPKNNNREYEWFLSEAHKRTKVLHGIEDKKPAAPAGDGKPAEVKGRKPATETLPKTLAHVPGGEGPGDVGDEFANLDALDGLEYETALAKMTPAQRERYLQAA